LLFDVILAGIGGFIVFKIKRKKKAAMLTSLALFLNPALFYNSVYWGQIDVLLGIGVLASFYLLYCNFYFLSALMLGFLSLTKLQAMVIIPWFFVLLVDKNKKEILGKMIAGFMFSAMLIFLPFIFAGNLWETLGIVYGTKNVFPYFSLNAFNLWWILGGGEPWPLNSELVFFNISAKTAGSVLFAIFYLILIAVYLMRKKRKKDFINWVLGTVMVVNGAFLLLTAMHERYLYLTVALLTFCYFLVDKNKRLLKFLTFVFSLTYLLNIAFVMNRVYYRDVIGITFPFILSLKFSFILSYLQIILGIFFFYVLIKRYFQTRLVK
jgi:Gpi18-like mannosyltransferase